MNNIDKVSTAVSQWMTEIASTLLPSARIPADTKIGKVMSALFNIDLSTYNPWKELNFLMTPTFKNFVEPMVYNLLKSLPEDKIIDVANAYIDSFISETNKKGEVNVFGITLEKADFERLRNILSEITKANGTEAEI